MDVLIVRFWEVPIEFVAQFDEGKVESADMGHIYILIYGDGRKDEQRKTSGPRLRTGN